MTDLVRRLLVAGLTLILAGGAIVPVTTQAATASSVDAVAGDASVIPERIQVDLVQVPYNLITDEKGVTTHVPWYPENKQLYTVQEVADENFHEIFVSAVGEDDNSYNVAGAMHFLGGGLLSTSNESLADYLTGDDLKTYGLTEGKDLTEFLGTYVYVLSWALKTAAQISLDPEGVDIDAIVKDYQENIRQKRLEASTSALIKNFMPMLDSYFGTKEAILGNYQEVLNLKSKIYLSQYSAEQLSKLDPEASEVQERALLGRSLENFVTQQDVDGTMKDVADGQLSMAGQPSCFVFKRGAAPITPSTVSSKPVTIRYVDEQGQSLKPDKALAGSLGTDYQAEPLEISGYNLVKTTGEETGKFTSSEQTITYTYCKAADPVVKKSVIYATRKIGLYDSPTFTKQSRLQWYAQKSRMNRPMFKIIGTATSKNGVKRYQVVDLNGQGITGYITAKTAYSTRLHYTTRPSRVTVINPDGLNAYTKKSLTGKSIHYRQGQVLKVKRVVTHNLNTRLVLSNGRYISGNKKLVIAGKYKMPKRVQAKTAVNRYDTVRLTKRNRHYTKKSQAVFKVQGWAYTNANNFRKGDTLRYKVAGGYITGNSRFVKVIE